MFQLKYNRAASGVKNRKAFTVYLVQLLTSFLTICIHNFFSLKCLLYVKLGIVYDTS